MAFATGFIGSLARSIDMGIQRSTKRTRDFNDELDKLEFERTMDEKNEWDDDVEEAQKAIENGSTVFTLPDGSIDPRGATFAAAALKRSGTLADYNNFIAKLKQAKADGDINPYDYFDQLDENYQIGSAKDYAKAFVGPMSDYSNIESDYRVNPTMNLLGKVLGRPVVSRKKARQKLELKLKAAGYDQMTINSDIPLPTIKFYDYKFNIGTIKKPQARLTTISEMLADPNVQKDKEKVEYLREQQNSTLQTIKDFGPRLQKVEANSRLVEILIAENSRITDKTKIAENNNLIAQYQNENDDISLEIELEEAGKAANLRENPLGLIQAQEKILVKKLTELKTAENVDDSEIADVTAQLNELLETKTQMALDSSKTFDGKKKVIQNLIESRTINDENYKNSEQYQIDRAALIDYDNKIAISNIDANNITPAELSRFEDGAERAMQNAIETSRFSGLVQAQIVGNEKLFIWNPGEDIIDNTGKSTTKAEFEAFKMQAKKDWYDSQMDIFRIGTQPALFAAAGHFYERNGFGKISEEQQKSFFSIGKQNLNQYDDSLRPNLLLEETTDAMEYTKPSPGDKVPSVPLSKPDEAQIKYRGVDGVKKLLNDVIQKDPSVTKDAFIRDYPKLYPGDIPADILAEIDNFYSDIDLQDSFLDVPENYSKKPEKKKTSFMDRLLSSKDNTVGKYKTDFFNANDTDKKSIIKQAQDELSSQFGMTEAAALKFIKDKWNPSGKGANAKYFYSGGLMSKQSI